MDGLGWLVMSMRCPRDGHAALQGVWRLGGTHAQRHARGDPVEEEDDPAQTWGPLVSDGSNVARRAGAIEPTVPVDPNVTDDVSPSISIGRSGCMGYSNSPNDSVR